MSACKEAILKLRKTMCLPASMEAMLDAAVTAEQHQGEPVTLPERRADEPEGTWSDMGDAHAAGWNACLDEVAKLGPLYARPAQGEVVGWQFYQQGKWWNGDDRIKDHRKNTEAAGIATRDVYAHADPAEFEAMRRLAEDSCNELAKRSLEHKAELEALRAQLAEMQDNQKLMEDMVALTAKAVGDDTGRMWLKIQVAFLVEVPELRAQLAEAHELLRDALERIEQDWLQIDEEWGPSDGGLAGEIESGTEELIPRLRAALSASAEPSTMAARIKAAACPECASKPCMCVESSAPVEIDERAAFEAAYDLGELLCMDGPYDNPRKNQAFATWQARAPLERKP